MKNIRKTIKKLQAIIADPNCARMNKSNVIGYLGELIVKSKLEEEGLQVDHKGNHSNYDLEVEIKGEIVKIDVKTSTLKDENKQGVKYWGWSLLTKGKKRDLTCTHFICLGLNEKLEVENYYIVKKDDLKHFPEGVGQFKNIQAGFRIFPAKPKEIKNTTWKDFHDLSEKLLKNKIILKKRENVKFLNYLI